MQKIFKSRRLRIAAALALLACTLTALAQEGTKKYPMKPIRLIVPATPAGPSDTIARALGQALSESMGTPVIVENRPGAGGVIAYEAAAKAAPDGYTLLLAGTSQMAIQEALGLKIPYDTVRDFSFIANIGTAPSLLVVAPSVPVSNVRELIALAKAKPGELSFAAPTPGSANHLAAEMLKSMAGIDVLGVPYKGASPAELDLISGRVTFMFHTLTASLPRVRAGQLKALGITSAQRAPDAPDIPTLAESGLPGFEVNTGFGLLGPAGLPAEITEKLNQETNKALRDSGFNDRLIKLGILAAPGTASAYLTAYRAERERWKKVVQDANVHVEMN
ncbi:tripartite tricarboxylate transporter substrate binding protein [Achromobacter spanius]|uniref:tripartite tricarboxylate transporter substrate binding protein n=1 Tax=Achromobacter spanius TaxID=217203 RepID=UPI0036F19277